MCSRCSKLTVSTGLTPTTARCVCKSQHPMLAGVDCCDPNGLDRVLAGRLVRQELRAFRRKGLNSRQREMMALLEPLTPCSSVLDVGCGVGAIGTTLLARGAVSGLFVDVSSAYLSAAREVASKAGVGKRATFYQDYFATSARSYPQADVAVLDRVVCCYPDAQLLPEKAAGHSQRTLVFSYPRPLWFIPVFRALCAFGMRLIGQEYRFFLHDPQLLLGAATGAGHKLVATHPAGLWQLVKVSKRASEKSKLRARRSLAQVKNLDSSDDQSSIP